MIQTSLQEKTRLNVENLSELRAFLVVVHDMIDSRAHGIAPHLPGIEGLQQFGRRSYIRHAGVEPHVVTMGGTPNYGAGAR
jgi:hypothetical protein